MTFNISKDQYGYMIVEKNKADSILYTSYIAMGTNDKELLNPIIEMIMTKPVAEWKRHPEWENMDDYMSRDQLTLLVAACRYFGRIDVIERIRQQLPLFSNIGKRWYCTPDFYNFLQVAAGKRWNFPWLLILSFFYLPFKLPNFSYHLASWWIWCHPEGLYKKLLWKLFFFQVKLHGAFELPWYPTKKNILYLTLSGQNVPDTIIHLCVPHDGITWEKGETLGPWYRPVQLDAESEKYQLDRDIVFAIKRWNRKQNLWSSRHDQ